MNEHIPQQDAVKRLSDYHAEHTALVARIEALQAEMRQAEAAYQEAQQRRQAELSAALTRREQVRGAIEALAGQ